MTSAYDDILSQLQALERKNKPKLLVVDDEPDNLDLLYRTFRREFQVFRAESGRQALEVLNEEGEVAVIISDQRMPEMKGTEFLSRTVPQFPHTMRIILTGFTDVEDLVDAINAGQVYKYITKPWEPDELKMVVDRAAQTYDLLKERLILLERGYGNMAWMTRILDLGHRDHFTSADFQPIAQDIANNFNADACGLWLDQGPIAQAYTTDPWDLDLAGDELIQKTQDQGRMQLWIAQRGQSIPPIYETAAVKIHLAIPMVLGTQTKGVLSLQWRVPIGLREQDLRLLELAAQQLALVVS